MLKKFTLNKKNIFKIIVFIAFTILCLNYLTNFMHIVSQGWFKTWQLDSDSIIHARAYIIKNYGIFKDYFLLTLMNNCEPGFYNSSCTYKVYASQFGLAGNILGLILNLPHGLFLCHLLLCVLFSGTLFYIVKWIYEEFGIYAALGAFLTAFSSKWLIASVRDIYWIVFIFILPFAVALYFLKKEEKTNKINITAWFWINFCIIAFKSLSGFEGITVILINSVLPLFYYAYKNSWQKSVFFKRFFIISISGLLGFFVAFAIHFIQLYLYYDHNLNVTVSGILNDISARTNLVKGSREFSQEIMNSLKSSKFYVLYLYLMKGKTLIIAFRMYLILAIYSLFLILYHFYGLKSRKVDSFNLLILISLTSPISWYVLASPHSYIHRHINYMYWSLPCLILIGAFVFYAVSYFIEKYLKRKKENDLRETAGNTEIPKF